MPGVLDQIVHQQMLRDVEEGRRRLDDGTISQGSWLDFNPTAKGLLEGASEMLGIAPSARVMDRITNLKSPLLRPQTPFEWADFSAGMAADVGQTALAAADLAPVAGAMAKAAPRIMGNESGVIVPKGVSIDDGENFFNMWGGAKPQRTEFQQVNRVPELQANLTGAEISSDKAIKGVLFGDLNTPGARYFEDKFGRNKYHGEMSQLYEQGKINTQQAEDLFHATVNRDEKGLSIFDIISDREIRRRAEAFEKEWKPYAETPMNISKSGGNIKTAGEIIDLDTSRGCLGFCPECYAVYGKSSQLAFPDPQAVKLTGKFSDNPEAIRRIGTNGEPNMNPELWKQYRDEWNAKLSSGQPLTIDEVDRLIDKSYDWSYTNQQLRKVGLDQSGGGADKTFVITKLQSLNGFDPSVVRNIEVSIDPLMPSHFFKSLKNIEQLKAMDPTLNISMRVRSVASGSDEVNTLQKMAVDFANKNELPILETRVRFKKADTMAMSQVLPEYYRADNQYKHISQYPSIKAGSTDPVTGGGYTAKALELHLPDGTAQPVDIMLVRPDNAMKGMTANQKKTAGVWEVWSGNEKIGTGLDDSAAMEMARNYLAVTNPTAAPSKLRVRDFSIGESPLSQFGLKPQLHRQCDVFNVGAGGCSKCQGCRAFINEGVQRAAMEK